jgi:hypothetical protein
MGRCGTPGVQPYAPTSHGARAQKVNKGITGFAKSAGSMATGFVSANAALAGFSAATGFFSNAANAASDMNESFTKSGAIFEDNAKGVQSWATHAATQPM